MTCTNLATNLVWFSALGGAGVGVLFAVAILFTANAVENRRRHQSHPHGVDDQT